MKPKHIALLVVASAPILLLAAVSFGSVDMPMADLLRAVVGSGDEVNREIVWGLRVPRALAAFGCGALLPAIAAGSLHGDGADAVGALSGLAFVGVYGLVMLLSLALALYLPSALVRSALRGSIGDGFAWRDNVDFIRANLGNYLLSLVVFLVAHFVSQFGIILCCVGVFPAAFASYLVAAAAFGQTVRLNRASI
jgi:hypothetical protein